MNKIRTWNNELKNNHLLLVIFEKILMGCHLDQQLKKPSDEILQWKEQV